MVESPRLKWLRRFIFDVEMSVKQPKSQDLGIGRIRFNDIFGCINENSLLTLRDRENVKI